jgi:hypothetical protein
MAGSPAFQARFSQGAEPPIRPPPKHLAESSAGRHWVARARRQASFVCRGGGFNAYSHGVVCGAWDESLRQDDRLR